jgi:hypothetical protein
MKFITYLYYNVEREEFFFVNWGKISSCLDSKSLSSIFEGKKHWMMKNYIYVDSFLEHL